MELRYPSAKPRSIRAHHDTPDKAQTVSKAFFFGNKIEEDIQTYALRLGRKRRAICGKNFVDLTRGTKAMPFSKWIRWNINLWLVVVRAAATNFAGVEMLLAAGGFHPDSPQDASWGERYFHMPDPDGHLATYLPKRANVPFLRFINDGVANRAHEFSGSSVENVDAENIDVEVRLVLLDIAGVDPGRMAQLVVEIRDVGRWNRIAFDSQVSGTLI